MWTLMPVPSFGELLGLEHFWRRWWLQLDQAGADLTCSANSIQSRLAMERGVSGCRLCFLFGLLGLTELDLRTLDPIAWASCWVGSGADDYNATRHVDNVLVSGETSDCISISWKQCATERQHDPPKRSEAFPRRPWQEKLEQGHHLQPELRAQSANASTALGYSCRFVDVNRLNFTCIHKEWVWTIYFMCVPIWYGCFQVSCFKFQL